MKIKSAFKFESLSFPKVIPGFFVLSIFLMFFGITTKAIGQVPNLLLCDYEGNIAVTNVYNNIGLPNDITVDNPFKTGINTSPKCTKLTVTAAWNEIGFLTFKDTIDLSKYSGVAYKIYAGGAATTHLKVVKNTDTNWWEDPNNTLTDVTSSMVPTLNQWVADTIHFFAGGIGLTFGFVLQPQVNGVYYIDDVVLIGRKTSQQRIGLKNLAAAKGKNIGTAVPIQTLLLDNSRADVQLINAEFNYSIADNDNKFNYIEPQNGVFTFDRMDIFVTKCLAEGRQIRGMGYVWHSSNPEWLVNGNFDRTQMLAIMKRHITTSMLRYKGRIKDWEIVNEAWAAPGEEGNAHPQIRKTSVWYKAIGPDYIDSAFVYAHRADPDAKLYYNDYGAEMMTEKADSIFAWLKREKAKGIPINGIGMQSHLSPSSGSSLKILTEMDQNVKRLNSIGMEVSITELDYGLTTTTAADLLTQAKVFRAVAKVWIDNPNLKTLIFWGLIDHESWLTLPEYGGKKAPLLFDDNLNPKIGYFGIQDLLTGEKEIVTPPLNLNARVISSVAISLIWDDPKLKYGNGDYIVSMNGDSINHTNSLSLIVTRLTPGTTYLITVQSTNDLGVKSDNSLPVVVTTKFPTDIENVGKSDQTLIYPNPVEKGESLKIDFNRTMDAVISIFDVTGKKIFSERIIGDRYNSPILNLEGFYLVNIISKSLNLSRKIHFK